MCFIKILKFTKKLGFLPSLENTVLQKPQEEGGSNSPPGVFIFFFVIYVIIHAMGIIPKK